MVKPLNLSNDPGLSYQPRIVTDGKNNVYVVWTVLSSSPNSKDTSSEVVQIILRNETSRQTNYFVCNRNNWRCRYSSGMILKLIKDEVKLIFNVDHYNFPLPGKE